MTNDYSQAVIEEVPYNRHSRAHASIFELAAFKVRESYLLKLGINSSPFISKEYTHKVVIAGPKKRVRKETSIRRRSVWTV